MSAAQDEPAVPDEVKYRELREYKKFQEELLYSRINIFIVVSSISAAGFSASSPDSGLFEFSLVGILVTIIWWINVFRQSVVVEDLREELEDDPIFRLLRKRRLKQDRARGKPSKAVESETETPKKLWFPWWKGRRRGLFSGQYLLVHLLPIVFLVFWVVMAARHWPW